MKNIPNNKVSPDFTQINIKQALKDENVIFEIPKMFMSYSKRDLLLICPI